MDPKVGGVGQEVAFRIHLSGGSQLVLRGPRVTPGNIQPSRAEVQCRSLRLPATWALNAGTEDTQGISPRSEAMLGASRATLSSTGGDLLATLRDSPGLSIWGHILSLALKALV